LLVSPHIFYQDETLSTLVLIATTFPLFPLVVTETLTSTKDLEERARQRQGLMGLYTNRAELLHAVIGYGVLEQSCRLQSSTTKAAVTAAPRKQDQYISHRFHSS
jgi:hypothetical protein